MLNCTPKILFMSENLTPTEDYFNECDACGAVVPWNKLTEDLLCEACEEDHRIKNEQDKDENF